MENSTLKTEETFYYSSEFIQVFKSGLVLHPSAVHLREISESSNVTDCLYISNMKSFEY